jgi:hypothetical protein
VCPSARSRTPDVPPTRMPVTSVAPATALTIALIHSQHYKNLVNARIDAQKVHRCQRFNSAYSCRPVGHGSTITRPPANLSPEVALTTKTPSEPTADPARPTPEAVIARTHPYLAIIVIAGIFVCCVGVGVLALMAVPLANVIAGKHTEFTFTFTLSLSVVFAASTAVTGTGWFLQTRQANRYKSRTKELKAKLAELSMNNSADAGKISNLLGVNGGQVVSRSVLLWSERRD